MSNFKVNRGNQDAGAAIEQFERYKETGNGKIISHNENKLGYSKEYAEGWARIFGKKEEDLEEKETHANETDGN